MSGIGRRTYAELTRANGRVNAQVQHYIDNAATMSDDQIDALPLQPYLRQGLKDIRKEATVKDMTASIEAGITIKTLSSELGFIQRWRGDREFIPIDHGGNIEIMPNKLLWFPNSGGFWYETIFAHRAPPDLFAKSVFVKTGRRIDYMTMYRDEINGKIDDATNTIIDMTGAKQTTARHGIESIPGVKIQR